MGGVCSRVVNAHAQIAINLTATQVARPAMKVVGVGGVFAALLLCTTVAADIASGLTSGPAFLRARRGGSE